MPPGGLRPILVSVLLTTTLLVPVTATSETCVSPGLFELCAQTPGTFDAGEASAVNGDVTATANGGLVAGVGAAIFVVDYEVRHDALASGESLRYVASLHVFDGDGRQVGSDVVFDTLTASDPPVQEELRVRVDRVDPLLDGGSVRVLMDATLVSSTTFEGLGQAISYAPVTLLVGPPEDVAERVEIEETVDAGTFAAGPEGASADALNGTLIVAQGTAVRLEATGTLSWSGTSGADSLFQRSSASLTVFWKDVWISASAEPMRVSCFSGPCGATAGSTPVELSIAIPGDAQQIRSDIDVHLRADWFYSASINGESTSDSALAVDARHNVLYAVGP